MTDMIQSICLLGLALGHGLQCYMNSILRKQIDNLDQRINLLKIMLDRKN